MGYAPEAWRDFAVTTGGLAGALTGLLFVAVSLHGSALAKSLALRSRAAQTLVLFMTPAISALVLVAPQPGTALFGIAGLTFLIKGGGGLYWMIPAVLAGLIGGVVNAWLFLVRLPI